jgi:hypothetical protein
MNSDGRTIVAALLAAWVLAVAGCSTDTTSSSQCGGGLGPSCPSSGSGTLGGGGGGTTTTPPPGVNPAGGIQFISATPTAIGVQGSGQTTTSTVVFKVTDASGAAAPGAAVNFNMSGPSGAYIGAPNDGTPTTASGTADANGLVSVVLNSGNAAGPVTISATVSAGIASFSNSTSVISIGGAVPSARHLSISASVLNLPGLVLDNFQSQILVLAADRFTNSTILAGTTVSFYTEAGAVGSSTVLDSTGAGTVTLRTQNPRPEDLPPLGPGNAGDGVSTLIAVVRGEESFQDANGNGLYDLGEVFTDAPSEPFIDANDNGVWDPGEFYVDTNGNGVFDGPNGVWDGPGCPQAGCISSPTIWVSMNVLFTGSVVNCSLTPATGTWGPLARGATQTFTFSVSDVNGNPPIAGTSITFAATNGTLAGATTFTVPDTSVPGPYVVGIALSNTNTGATTLGATVSATVTSSTVPVGGTCISPSSSGTLS